MCYLKLKIKYQLKYYGSAKPIFLLLRIIDYQDKDRFAVLCTILSYVLLYVKKFEYVRQNSRPTYHL